MRLTAEGNGQRGDQEVVSHANESARVEEKARAPAGRGWCPTRRPEVPSSSCAGWSSRPSSIDLLDIVAGGNGLGHRREHGVNPANAVYDHRFVGGPDIVGDHQFHFVSWHTILDGVFVPDGSAGPVQVDSAGHLFGGFPATSNTTYGSVWSRAADIAPETASPAGRNGSTRWAG